ncbi:MAG: porin family protein [Tatlockia sp.]|nr:porin family protein [Tatlockia sp.]
MRTAFFSATLLASSLATAAIPIDGWYSSVFGGYSYLPNNLDLNRINNSTNFNNPLLIPNFNNTFSPPHHNAIDSGKNGINAGGRLGFQGGPMRYEAELTYINASTDRNSHANRHNSVLFQPFSFYDRYSNVRGQTNAFFGMGNVYFDFRDFVPCISPFIGAGLGYGWVETTIKWDNNNFFTFNPFNQFNTHFRSSDNAFAYQGTAGLTFNFAEAWALNIAYRYIATTKLDNLGKKFQGNLASVGLVYRFNEYNYK